MGAPNTNDAAAYHVANRQVYESLALQLRGFAHSRGAPQKEDDEEAALDAAYHILSAMERWGRMAQVDRCGWCGDTVATCNANHDRTANVYGEQCAPPSHYKGWNIHYDNPPTPLRSMDWCATSPDYDVDCDEDGFHVCAGQQVHAATYDELVKEIDAAIEEMDQ